MKKNNRNSNFAFGCFLFGFVVGCQFLMYWLLAPLAKEAFGDNGTYLLVAIIVFSFLFIWSAAFFGILNFGTSTSKSKK